VKALGIGIGVVALLAGASYLKVGSEENRCDTEGYSECTSAVLYAFTTAILVLVLVVLAIAGLALWAYRRRREKHP
jgi:heme/copper-type cytochrome/quinol oxidase subunit 2